MVLISIIVSRTAPLIVGGLISEHYVNVISTKRKRA